MNPEGEDNPPPYQPSDSPPVYDPPPPYPGTPEDKMMKPERNTDEDVNNTPATSTDDVGKSNP